MGLRLGNFDPFSLWYVAGPQGPPTDGANQSKTGLCWINGLFETTGPKYVSFRRKVLLCPIVSFRASETQRHVHAWRTSVSHFPRNADAPPSLQLDLTCACELSRSSAGDQSSVHLLPVWERLLAPPGAKQTKSSLHFLGPVTQASGIAGDPVGSGGRGAFRPTCGMFFRVAFVSCSICGAAALV